MAEHPNATLLRKGYEAFASGDVAALTELFSGDVVWHLAGNNQISGVHRGREAVFAMFAQIGQLSGGTFKIDVHDVVANDEHAVALTRATGSREGRQYDSLDTDVYHVEGGKVTEFWSFAEDTKKADEFWG